MPLSGNPAFLSRSRIIRSHPDAVSACREIESLVGSAFSVPLHELRAPSRGPAATAFARQVAMYLAHVELGLSLSLVGAHFGRDRTTVSHACRRVEDRRDDTVVDMALSCLTSAVARREIALGAMVAQ